MRALHRLLLLLSAFAWMPETGAGCTSCRDPAWDSAAVFKVRLVSCDGLGPCSNEALTPVSVLGAGACTGDDPSFSAPVLLW